jgi:hypothetical protein
VAVEASLAGAFGGYEISSESGETKSGSPVVAAAPAGKKVVGGGYEGLLTRVTKNCPATDGSGWVVEGFGPDLQPVTVYAICSDVS